MPLSVPRWILAAIPTLLLDPGAALATDLAGVASGAPGAGPASSLAQAGPRDLPTLELVFFDPLNALPCGLESLAGEADAVLRPLGVRIAWRQGGPGTLTRRPQLHVVLLDGPAAERLQLVLGATPHEPGASLHFWISMPAVKRVLGLDPVRDRALSLAQRVQVARAIARVVVHETVHALAPELPHAPAGLMCDHLDRAFLLASRVPIDVRAAAALRAAFEALARGGRPAAPALAASE